MNYVMPKFPPSSLLKYFAPLSIYGSKVLNFIHNLSTSVATHEPLKQRTYHSDDFVLAPFDGMMAH
jgi:hypothetical protein